VNRGPSGEGELEGGSLERAGLKRLVEIARGCNVVHLIALRDFGLEDVWLVPGEHFPCDQTIAAELIRAGLAERLVNPS
jgi:hypothetical protein